MNKLIVISGCSGGGKSTLLSELHKAGFSVVPEVGRNVVKEQLAINGDLLPWKNPQLFCETVIERSVAAYHQAKEMVNARESVIFFDRCFLDGVSYYQALKIEDSDKYNYLINELRYHPLVFMAPPWKEIFCQDDERKHSFDDAVSEYEQLLEFYAKYDYQILDIPKVSIKERIQFIMSAI